MRRSGSILVIDDEEIMREILEALLAREGYDVRLSASAAEGLETFQMALSNATGGAKIDSYLGTTTLGILVYVVGGGGGDERHVWLWNAVVDNGGEESAATESAPEVHKVADRRFSTDTLYALLVAEMAIDRKRYDIALGNYIQQAASTQDPGVAARATQASRASTAARSVGSQRRRGFEVVFAIAVRGKPANAPALT